jgi:hypothetical protein
MLQVGRGCAITMSLTNHSYEIRKMKEGGKRTTKEPEIDRLQHLTTDKNLVVIETK